MKAVGIEGLRDFSRQQVVLSFRHIKFQALHDLRRPDVFKNIVVRHDKWWNNVMREADPLALLVQGLSRTPEVIHQGRNLQRLRTGKAD
jgi:hypothetical protein